MKIAVSGKGGVGKTTLAAILARSFAADGFKVLAIDADPVASLGAALGIPDADKITPISRMKDEIYSRTEHKPGAMGGFFKLNPKVDDLPDLYFREHGGIKLMVLGTVEKGGGGCICPENVLLKALVTHLLLGRKDIVILDMEAGVEHLGRATAHAVDLMIAVVEPGSRSIEAAKMIKNLAAQIGIKNIVAAGNKIRGEKDIEYIKSGLGDIRLLGYIPFDIRIVEADLAGKPPFADSETPSEITSLLDTIKSYTNL